MTAPVIPPFDQRADQQVPLDIVRRGKEYRVYHTLSPLTETQHIKISKLRSSKNSSDLLSLFCDIWNENVKGIGGYAVNEDSDFKQVVKQDEKIAGIRALEFCQVEPASFGDGLVPIDDGTEEYTLSLLSSGEIVYVRHRLKSPNADQYRTFTRIVQNMNTIRKGQGESFDEQLVHLYHQLHDGTYNYVYYDVKAIPFNHKALVALTHLTSQSEFVEGK